MELAEGRELACLMEEGEVFPEARIQIVMRQLLSAVDYLNTLDIVHRDIKPENILVGRDTKIKLIDFNVSRCLSIETQTLRTITGTPVFRAPEMLQSLPYD